VSYEPVIDTVQLVHLADDGAGVRPHEVQALAYLSCVLSVFDGKRVSEWGYNFLATPAGMPYAEAVDSAINDLVAAGVLEAESGSLRLSLHGTEMRSKLVQHQSFEARKRYVDAAASTTLALALPRTTGAIALEPQLKAALSGVRRRRLLDSAGLIELDPYLKGLRSIDEIGVNDLFASAVVLLKYLLAESEAETTIDV